MKIFRLSVYALVLLVCCSSSALAAEYYATLTGDQEVPDSGSAATGDCAITVVGDTVSVSCEFSGLEAAASASHIHKAPAGVNGPVVLGLNATADTSGAISGGGQLADEDLAALRTGGTYVNLHTSAHTGGEIRGQILRVPANSIPTLSGWGSLAIILSLMTVGWLALRRTN